MSYRQFALPDIETKLGLAIHQSRSLFEAMPPVEISEHLHATLKENIPLALNINTTKARSGMLVTPLMVEIRRAMHRTVSLFAGIDLNVDESRGLWGECDFLICNRPNQLYPYEPIVTVVEATSDNIRVSIAPCIAMMYAARCVHRQPSNEILGIVTTGNRWKFMILAENNLFVDYEEYLIKTPGKILAIVIEHIKKLRC